MKKLLLLAALLTVLIAPLSRASSNDCLFDGNCGPRPNLSSQSPEPVSASAPPFSYLSGMTKGASEGATLGFMGTLTPAVSLMSAGIDRPDSGHSEAYYYGGIALGILLYIPALVIGALGGLFGAAAGAIVPEKAKNWDGESAIAGDRR